MKMFTLKILKRSVVLIIFGSAFSISANDLRGYVRNSENNVLVNAHVLVLNTTLGVATDSLGYFMIPDLPEGEYTLQISHLGYESLITAIEIKDSIITHNFILFPGFIQLNQGIIISASRFQSRKFSSPLSISSIDITELEKSFPRTTPESLITHGAWVQKTSHGGGSPFVRGLTGYHTLLMIDGIRLNNSTFRSGPNQYLNTLDPLILSNIEVIRSSGSVQYGSDALGGTIHFFTKMPEFSNTGKLLFEPRVIAKYVSQGVNKINNGIYNTFTPGMERIIRSEATVSGKNVAFYGGAGYKKFNDMDAAASLGTLKPTAYDEYDADAKLLVNKGKHKFTAAFQLVKQNNVPLYHNLVSGTYSEYSFDPQLRSLIYIKHDLLIGNNWARKINTTVYSQNSAEERHKQKTGEIKQSIDSDEVRSIGVLIDLFSAPATYWTFNSGLDINFDKVNSSTRITSLENNETQFYRGLYPDNSNALNFAFFSLHQIEVKRVVLNAGIRHNTFQIAATDTVFGNTRIVSSALVGNIGLSYKLNDGLRIISMVNTGFRAPNINDVSGFGIADFRYEIPNSNLKPERSVSYEIGWKQKSSTVSSSFSLFNTHLTNLITNVLTSYQGQDSVLINAGGNDYIYYYRKDNANKAFIYGFEAETEVQFYRWLNFYGRVYYTFGQNKSNNEPISRIPPANGVAGLNLCPGKDLHFRAEFLFAGKQDRLSSGDISDNRIQDGGTPAWNVINISAGYNALRWMELNFGINNLFDEAYRIHGSGVDCYGRNIWMGLKFKI